MDRTRPPARNLRQAERSLLLCRSRCRGNTVGEYRYCGCGSSLESDRASWCENNRIRHRQNGPEWGRSTVLRKMLNNDRIQAGSLRLAGRHRFVALLEFGVPLVKI